MAYTEMTPQQYADKRKINVSHVQRYCKAEKHLDGVSQVKRFGRSYVLVVDTEYIDSLPKNKSKK